MDYFFRLSHLPLGEGLDSIKQITLLVLTRYFYIDRLQVTFLGEAETVITLELTCWFVDMRISTGDSILGLFLFVFYFLCMYVGFFCFFFLTTPLFWWVFHLNWELWPTFKTLVPLPASLCSFCHFYWSSVWYSQVMILFSWISMIFTDHDFMLTVFYLVIFFVPFLMLSLREIIDLIVSGYKHAF